jgi:hypothetical protein
MVEKAGVPADLRHHDRLATFRHGPGHALAQGMAGGARLPGETDAGPDLQLSGTFVQEGHGAADGAAAASQDGQHAGESGVQVHISGQRLAHVHQGAELSGLAGLGAGRAGELTQRRAAVFVRLGQ